MVNLGMLNSRMKDFYDLWLLANQFDFHGPTLVKALQKTFSNRGATLMAGPVALTAEFCNDSQKIAQWNAFIRKGRLDHAPKELKQIIEALKLFLMPPAETLEKGQKFNLDWKAPGPWRKP